MIEADVIVDNKVWKKYINNPNIYLKKKLKKAERKISTFKKKKTQFYPLIIRR